MHALDPRTPASWREGREWFALDDGCCDEALPLVADRIILQVLEEVRTPRVTLRSSHVSQHPPWLQWARAREPLATLEGSQGVLSKRKLLLLFPQVHHSPRGSSRQI